jgi:CHAT domain-containing protein
VERASKRTVDDGFGPIADGSLEADSFPNGTEGTCANRGIRGKGAPSGWAGAGEHCASAGGSMPTMADRHWQIGGESTEWMQPPTGRCRRVPLRAMDYPSGCHSIVSAHRALRVVTCTYGSAHRWLGMLVLLVGLLVVSPCLAQEASYTKSFGRILPGTTMANLPEEVRQMVSEAFAMERQAQLGPADRKYGEIESWAKGHRNTAIEGVALEGMGRVHSKMGDQANAIAYFQRAATIFNSIRDGEEEGIVLEGMAASLEKMGEPAKALQVLKKTLVVYGAIHFPDGESTTLNKIGSIYHSWGEFAQAIDAYEKALRIDQSLNRTRRQAMVLGNLGMVYRSAGDPKKALELDQKALGLSARSAPISERVRNFVGVALDQMFLGENKLALSYLQQADDIANGDSKDISGKAIIEFNRGAVVGNLGSRDEERKLYESSLAKVRSIASRDLAFESAILEGLASSYATTGDVNRAIGLYREAHAIADKLGNRQLQATILMKVSFLARRNGKVEDAARLLEQALPLARQSHDLSVTVGAMLELVDAYDALGNALRASALMQEALRSAQAAQDVALRGRVLATAMSRASREGKVETAIFYGKGAITAYQRIQAGLNGLPDYLTEHYKNSRKGTYEELARLLMSVNRVDEAQEILDLLKLREHADFVRSAPDAQGRSAPTLSKMERELEERFKQVGGKAAGLGREREELLNKIDRTSEDAARLRELDAQLESVNHASERILSELREKLLQRFPGAADPLPALREARGMRDTLRELGPGVVAIRAFLTDDAYCVILITSEVVIPKIVTIKKADVERQIANLLEKIASPKADPQPSAAQLYQTIVGPVARELRDAQAQTLMWSLDGVLRYIPLAALHDGKHYLVEDYRIAVFTPASQSRLERPSKTQWRGLALGYTKGAYPLPNAAAEVRAIVRDPAHQGGLLDGKILLDDAFTKEAMLKALEMEGPFSVVHIASHFQFRPGADTDSFLVTGGLSNQFTLADMKDAPHLFRGVELVTLSACDTAQGEVRSDGREIESLAVLTQQQGAASVLATLWRVADASTAELMRNFYSLRLQNPGMSKAEALRQAQVSMLRGTIPGAPPSGPTPVAGDLRHAHPYFWAPFVLIGNWR